MLLKHPYIIYPTLLEINPDSKKRYAIKIRVYERATKTPHYFNTDYWIDLKQWDGESRYVRKGHPDYSHINSILSKICEEIREGIDECLQAGKPVNLKLIISGEKPSEGIIEYTEKVLPQLKGKLSVGRIAHYRKLINKLKEYSPDVTFNQVDVIWLRKFEHWMREKGLANNYIHANWKVLIRIFNLAKRDGITNNYPFSRYDNPKYESVDRIPLLIEEINAIEDLIKKPLSEGQLITANYYLLSCYAGYRISELYRFNEKFVQGDRLLVRAKKNSKWVIIDIHPALRETIDRILKLPPLTFSEQHFRKYLKEIGKLAGIEKEIYPHQGRHSFATIGVEIGISQETIAEVMGINKTTLKHYYRVTDKKIQQEMSSWNKLRPAEK